MVEHAPEERGVECSIHSFGTKNMLAFVPNLPYTLIGLIIALFSLPNRVRTHKQPYSLIIYVKSLWWAVGYLKGARATTIGHVVILGPDAEKGDLEHELVHVAQHQRAPLLQPFLYYAELFKNGYRNNKYEIEAYKTAGNRYKP